MADTKLETLVINIGTESAIQSGLAGGTITEDMLALSTDGKYIQTTQVSISTSDWSSNTASVTVSGVTADSNVFVAPAPTLANIKAYTAANVFCSAVSADTVTFTCENVPTANLTVNIGVE